MAKANVIEVTDRNFVLAVLQESKKRPVVVDFWATWCAPCRALAPVLEKLAAEGGGAWVLAKVDTDAQKRTAAQFQIRSIPTVMAFKDGAMVAQFAGALPEGKVRTWLEGFLPGAAEALIAEGDAALALGDLEAAERKYEAALDEKARLPGALLGLAKVAAERGDETSAEHSLGLITAADMDKAAPAMAQIRVKLHAKMAKEHGGEQSLRERIAKDAADHEAKIDLAAIVGGGGKLRDAMELLLEVIAKDGGDMRQKAREALLQLFEVAGPKSELTEEFRGKLAKELFK